MNGVVLKLEDCAEGKGYLLIREMPLKSKTNVISKLESQAGLEMLRQEFESPKMVMDRLQLRSE